MLIELDEVCVCVLRLGLCMSVFFFVLSLLAGLLADFF